MKNAEQISAPAGTTVGPAPEWAATLELATREVFEMMLGTELAPLETRSEPKYELISMVGLAGRLCGVLSVSFTKESAAAAAAQMLGMSSDEVGDSVVDAVGEISNMVAGNFKTKISSLAESCLLSVPTVVTGSDYTLHSLAEGAPLAVSFAMAGKPLRVVLQTHP